MSFKLDTIVEVEWNDANSRSSWSGLDVYLAHDVAKCRTVGYLLKKSKKSITLVMSQSEEDCDCNAAMSIPMPWVTKFRVVR